MKMLLSAALLFAATAVSAAADDKAPKGDLGKLQGSWTAKAGPDNDIAIHLTFKGSDVALKVTMPDGNSYETKGEVKVDDQAKPNKTLDWRKLTSPDGDDLGENLSIYEFEDADTIKVCSGGGGNPRPTEFKAGEGGAPYLVIMSREKGEEKKKDKDATATKGDLSKFQGKWTTKVGPNNDVVLNLAINDHTVTLSGTTPNGENFELKGELKLDDQAKPNKTIDWVNFVGPQGNEVPANLGIYTFEDADTIKICSGGPGKERPTEFKSGDEGSPRTIILKREKS